RKVLARERVDIGEVKTQSQRHFIGLDCVLGVGR
ncbi:polysaccharide pyruvyl transferase family protein, partial [Bifidobacterium bifidum]